MEQEPSNGAGNGAAAITVIIADDFAPMRRQIAAILGSEDRVAVIGQAPDGAAAVNLTRELQPDVLLLDISLPGLSGFAVARDLRKTAPGVRILFLSEHDGAEWTIEAFAAGACGLVLKSEASQDLLPAVYAVGRGEKFVSAACVESPEELHRRAARA